MRELSRGGSEFFLSSAPYVTGGEFGPNGLLRKSVSAGVGLSAGSVVSSHSTLMSGVVVNFSASSIPREVRSTRNERT